MSDENWMAPSELRGIADYCEALTPLWDALTSGPKSGVSIDIETSIEIAVYDGNGDVLGHIKWAEDGAAFYAKAGE